MYLRVSCMKTDLPLRTRITCPVQLLPGWVALQWETLSAEHHLASRGSQWQMPAQRGQVQAWFRGVSSYRKTSWALASLCVEKE
ncbi:hypothetical protein AGOR_G00187680 [Albula goreensis]|uniref:Uncharacterized protein n=1 Tax=Albula goreensis TaxID=1534307 RepID=A0A8T3D1J3_9TELE|nr:hypothetical protein AGOR_G00187680 [Albula goreensis]